MIGKLEIIGLFGERNITIDLTSDVRIIVGENGTGKTHILNILYYLMSNQLLELLKIDFKVIYLNTVDNDNFVLSKDELEHYYYNNRLNRGPLGLLQRHLTKSDFEELMHAISNSNDIKNIPSIKDLLFKGHPRYRMAIKDLERELDRGNFSDNLFSMAASENINNIKNFLNISYKKYKNNSMIYLPTYRRIERGLQHLIKNSELIEELEVEDTNTLINFGMKDTSEIIGSLLGDISNSFLQAYAELSGDMLRELLKANDNEIEEIKDLNLDIVKLVLQRVGNKISDEDKNRILEIVKENKTTQQNYPILSMIKNLIELYEGSSKKLEDRIETFVAVCNRYLVDKEFNYNKNNVSLSILNQFNNKSIIIDNLSSGEKQIVSLFAKIYLKEVHDFIMFFDEPELSLSIEWQKMLLNDILKTGNCKFLFVTTHSPFIFENENLLMSTFDIAECTEVYGNFDE